jgi:hypothetical protein
MRSRKTPLIPAFYARLATLVKFSTYTDCFMFFIRCRQISV